jgi:histidinol phosphatase-like PHP family hydrolase
MYTPDHDLHVHTYLSSCCTDKARQTPPNILQRAHALGLRTLGFTDHVWANPEVPCDGWYRPQGPDRIDALRRELAAQELPLRVLVGCEADMAAPGRFGLTPQFAESVDFVLLACNHDFPEFVEHPSWLTPRAMAERQLRFFRSAVQSGLADVIPHPFFPCSLMDVFEPSVAAVSDQEFLDAFGLAAERGVAMEITTVFFPSALGGVPDRPEWHLDTPLRFLTLARDAGCRFVLGSDAHQLDDMNRLPKLQWFVDRLGLTREYFRLRRNWLSEPESEAR